jgi:hypothetical protein
MDGQLFGGLSNFERIHRHAIMLFIARPACRHQRVAGQQSTGLHAAIITREANGFGRQPSALLPYDFSLLQIGSSEPDIYTLSPFSDDNGDAMS